MELCSICNKYPLVNKKYKLCNNCNYIRLHGTKKITKPIRCLKKNIKLVSLKQLSIRKSLSNLKTKIREDAIFSGSYYCKGCGKTGQLDCSHIISIKHRPDLQLDYNNIQLLCRECHLKHESWNKESMMSLLCITETTEYLKEHDQQRYQRLIELK